MQSQATQNAGQSPARHTPMHRARISCGLYRAPRALVLLVCIGSREIALRVPR